MGSLLEGVWSPLWGFDAVSFLAEVNHDFTSLLASQSVLPCDLAADLWREETGVGDEEFASSSPS